MIRRSRTSRAIVAMALAVVLGATTVGAALVSSITASGGSSAIAAEGDGSGTADGSGTPGGGSTGDGSTSGGGTSDGVPGPFIVAVSVDERGIFADGDTATATITVTRRETYDTVYPPEFRAAVTVTWPAMLEAQPVVVPSEDICAAWRAPGATSLRPLEDDSTITPVSGDACLLDNLQEPGSSTSFQMPFTVHDVGSEPGAYFGEIEVSLEGVTLVDDVIADYALTPSSAGARAPVGIAGRFAVEVQTLRNVIWPYGPATNVNVTVRNNVTDFASLDMSVLIEGPPFASFSVTSGCSEPETIEAGIVCRFDDIPDAGDVHRISVRVSSTTLGAGEITATASVDGAECIYESPGPDDPDTTAMGDLRLGFGAGRGAVPSALPSALSPRLAVPDCHDIEVPFDEVGRDSIEIISDELRIGTVLEAVPRYTWPDGPEIAVTITATRDADDDGVGFASMPATAVLDVDWPPSLELQLDSATGCLETGAELEESRQCTLTGMFPAESRSIALTFTPTGEIDDAFISVCGFSLTAGSAADGGPLRLPWYWIGYDSATVTIDDELVALDVELGEDYVWAGSPNLTATITATRAERDDESDGEYNRYGQLAVGVRLSWPAYLTPVDTPPPECETWEDSVCEVLLDEPGSSADITMEFTVGEGVTDGVVRAEGAFLVNHCVNADGYPEDCAGECDYSDDECSDECDDSDDCADRYREDLPVEWVVPAEEPVAAIEPFIPLDVKFLDDHGDEVDEAYVWPYGPNLTAKVTVTREDFVQDGLRDPFHQIEVGVLLTWPSYLTPTGPPTVTSSGPPTECRTWDGAICTIRLAEPGDAAVISMEFAVGEGVTDGVVRAEGATLIDRDQSYSGDDQECGFGYVVCTDLPTEWVIPDEEPVGGIAPIIPLDVEVARDLVWEGDENVGATVTVTRDLFGGTRRDPFQVLVVDVEITWPEFLSPTGAPTGCESWDGSICVVVLPEPGAVVVIGFDFEVGAAPPGGIVEGEVRAAATRLVERYDEEDCDAEESQCRELPVEWVTPDEASVTRIRVAIPMSVDVERDLVWQGGSDVGATVVVTRYGPDELDGFDPLGVLAVEVEITWPAFLHPVGAPTGCESWDGSICVVVLPEPIYEVAVGLEFSVVGTPPGGVVAGEVRAVGVGLVNRTSEADQELPEAWVTPDADTVTRIKGSVSLDLTLGHDPGYTGGKQLVVTTKVTRETTGPELPDLEVGLDFAWAAYLTRTAVTGCASFTGTTCIVTGLDDPGASAVVKLIFTMPAPTLPPVPEVLPRTDDISVDGVSLSFVPPETEKPSSGAALGSSPAALGPIPADTGSPPPPPLDGTLPPSWIGQDRAPFTVLQPSVVIAQSVATPGDAVAAYGKYLPPDADVTLRWEGLATMAAQQWPNPDAPTESSWSLVILRWQFAGPRTLIMHSEDGLFADIPSSNQLLVVPRSAAGPDLVGRGG